MKQVRRSDRLFDWLEFVFAVLLSGAILFLHFRFLTHAGPLWRDEISSLHIGMSSSVKEFFSALVFDSIPPLFPIVLSAWHFLGFAQTDSSLRWLGALIGALVLAAVWLCSRLTNRNRPAPLWPLLLFAMNPIVMGEGDSLRPYGLGMFFLLITFALLWHVISQDRHRKTLIVLGALIAALSVQALYLNSLIVFAICSAAFVLCAVKADWSRAAAIFLIGLFAAASLLPYLSIFRSSRGLFAIQAIGGGFSSISNELVATITNGRGFIVVIWCFLFAFAFAVLIFPRLRRFLGCDEAQPLLLFAVITIFIAATGTIFFVWNLDLPVNRYFLPLLAVGGVSIHLCAETLRYRLALRAINLLAAIIVAVATVPPLYAALGTRSTNCDLVAARVANDANADDLIVLTRFSFGISFHRYYHGVARWRTIPEVADHTQHRLDLVRQAMMQTDPLRDLFAEMETTLRAGHRIYFVGSLPAAEPVDPLPPAPLSIYGWKMFAYIDNWQKQIAAFVNQHTERGEEISLGEIGPVEQRENFGLFVVSGWQDRQ